MYEEREARVFSYIVFECLDIPVRHELELYTEWVEKTDTFAANLNNKLKVSVFFTLPVYGFSNESKRNRMFSFADLNRILNQA
jgi:hypothetical protein